MKKQTRIIRLLKKAFAGFLWGIVVGAVIGALGGTMDKGSMFILVPSGPPFWAIVGAFVGSIVGALFGALLGLLSKNTSSLKSGRISERGK